MALRRRFDERLRDKGGLVELLRLPALAYGLATGVRNQFYGRGLLPVTRLDVPVVSIGNLSVGGTGKSPMALLLARRFRARGWKPGLLSRGYGSKGEGESISHNDEAMELAGRDPGLAHAQDPDRVAAGRRLEAEGVDVLILDDGFQHRRLARDLDLVLLDASRPWGLPAPVAGGGPVRALLPRGFLREFPGSLARADAIILTRSDQIAAAALTALLDEVDGLAPGVPVLIARHAPTLLRPLGGGDGVPVSMLAGREVDLISGIGNPEAFEETVRSLGARIRQHLVFPDHHSYDRDELAALDADGLGVVTTGKDAPKLASFLPDAQALEIELALQEGDAVLTALLDSLVPGKPERERAAIHSGLHG